MVPMRIAGLLALALFFPVFAHAAVAPTLTTYTLSYETIYPSAGVGSGFATTTAVDVAFSEQVKTSIKIVSASGDLVKLLYSSSSVTNPTPKVWDGTNTAGTSAGNGTYTILISATSTATGLTMNNSSKTITIASVPASSTDSLDTTSSTASVQDASPPASSGASPEYMPIPTLRIFAGGNRTVSSGADTAFTAVIYDGLGNRRDDAIVTWSFGDGMRRTGASVFHKFYAAGTYAIVIRATTSDAGEALQKIVVTAKDAGVRITNVSVRGITLTNTDSRTIDLSNWRLEEGGQEFKIPPDTEILAGQSILFASQVIQLPLAVSAVLKYPSGEVATTYLAAAAPVVSNVILPAGGGPASGGQPSQSVISYKKVSEVEPIPSARTEAQIYEKAVNAPAATTELAAAGAALSSAPLEPVASAASGIFKSPWTLGFLGMMILVGGAFIFL